MNHLHVNGDEKYLREQKAWDLFLQKTVGVLNQRIDSNSNTYYVTNYFRRFAEKIRDTVD